MFYWLTFVKKSKTNYSIFFVFVTHFSFFKIFQAESKKKQTSFFETFFDESWGQNSCVQYADSFPGKILHNIIYTCSLIIRLVFTFRLQKEQQATYIHSKHYLNNTKAKGGKDSLCEKISKNFQLPNPKNTYLIK